MNVSFFRAASHATGRIDCKRRERWIILAPLAANRQPVPIQLAGIAADRAQKRSRLISGFAIGARLQCSREMPGKTFSLSVCAGGRANSKRRPRLAQHVLWFERKRRRAAWRRTRRAPRVQLLKEPFWDDDTSPLIRTMTQFCSKETKCYLDGRNFEE